MKNFRLSSCVIAAHWIALAMVFGFLLIKAALQFFPHYDTLAYHIPAALHAWDRTTYMPEPILVDVIRGMPPLAHWMQGLLIVLIGRISAANLINPLSLLAAAAVYHWLYRETKGTRWFLTIVLAIPMIVLHCLTSYIDLWTGSLLFIAWLTLAWLQSERSSNALTERKTPWVLAICFLSLAAAFNSKFQAWPIVVVLGGWLIPVLWKMARTDVSMRKLVIFQFFVFILLTSYTPIRNYRDFGNPTFPISNPLFQNRTAQPVDLSRTEELHRQMPEYLWEAPQWQRFGESVLELNRLQPGSENFQWSLDQAGGPLEWKSPNHRMGGWFFGTVSLLLITCTLGTLRKFIPLKTALTLLTCTMAAAVCPQSHELRYWLFLPMSAAALSANTLQRLQGWLARLLKGLYVSVSVYVLISTLRPVTLKTQLASAFAPPQAVAFWQSQKTHPTSSVLLVRNAKPYAIFWSGPEFNSYRVKDLGNAPVR